jgi:DNA-binding MltR family transcriptional regulator
VDVLNAELDAESDRACIILMANILDDALKYRISKCLIFALTEAEFDKVFRFEGPLGTFSGRMEMACIFGFVDEYTYRRLDIIRELRNACAHSLRAMTFSDASIANVAKRLGHPVGSIPTPPDGVPLKTFFLGVGVFFFQVLCSGSREEVIKDELRKFYENASPEQKKIIEKRYPQSD